MRAVVQRVKSANVKINNKICGQINNGYMVLLGITHDDSSADVDYIADKLINLRIFNDEQDKMNLSLLDVNGEILLVSQFTLYGDARKGRRPSFIEAARPETAIPLYKETISKLKSLNIPVQTGEFGADMAVELINDGPVTILLDSKKQF